MAAAAIPRCAKGGAREPNQISQRVGPDHLPDGRPRLRLSVGAAGGLAAPGQFRRPSPGEEHRLALVYVKPGATFGKYDKVAILTCLVEFDKNWQSNYNSQQVDPSTFVTTDNMNQIKKDLAAEFMKVFTRELKAGGYQIADTAAPDVLVLRPAIINLRVTAPDLMTPGINMTVVRSAGSATLYLELWDSMTNTILARVMDSQADQGWADRWPTACRTCRRPISSSRGGPTRCARISRPLAPVRPDNARPRSARPG